MAVGLEVDQLFSRRGNARCPLGIGEGDDAVGVADIEGLVDERHAERLVQSLQKHFSHFRDTVAIGVPPERNAVSALPEGSGAPHRALHGIVESRFRRSSLLDRLGDQHVARG